MSNGKKIENENENENVKNVKHLLKCTHGFDLSFTGHVLGFIEADKIRDANFFGDIYGEGKLRMCIYITKGGKYICELITVGNDGVVECRSLFICTDTKDILDFFTRNGLTDQLFLKCGLSLCVDVD